MADVTPLHKKGKKDLKENYRPVSILPIFLKVFERSMFAQMSSFFVNFLSKQQCGFRKGYSIQQCILALLEKWKRAVDSGQMFGALLTVLSKPFDCLDHKLLFAKLNATVLAYQLQNYFMIIYQIGNKELRQIELIVPG